MLYNSSKSVYKQALQHKSYDVNNNNERLEFLGDAILNFLVSEHVFLKNQNKEEGFLSQKRAVIVGRKHLNQVGKKIIDQKDIKTKIKIIPENIYGNTLEAIIGAVYIDKGINEAKKFVFKNIIHSDFLNDLINTDYKSELQKTIQKKKQTIKYLMVKSKGPEHNKEFEVALYVNNNKITKAKGFSIKEAEQKAAEKALKSVF